MSRKTLPKFLHLISLFQNLPEQVQVMMFAASEVAIPKAFTEEFIQDPIVVSYFILFLLT